jgi:hypothetical protein
LTDWNPRNRLKPRNPGEGRGTIPNKVFKILKTCLIVPVCLFSLAQCGLEYLPYLTPPAYLVPGTSSFKVRKLAANDDEKVPFDWEYQGIELYYKFYLPTPGVPESEKAYTQLSELTTAKGFYRISKYLPADVDNSDKDKSIRRPLIEIDTGLLSGNVDFEIKLVDMEIEEKKTPAVVVEQIRRGVPYDYLTEPDEYPFFQRFRPPDDFDELDDDINPDLYAEKGNIIMTMYALSYGKQNDLLLDLYSDAVYLGERSVDFGW